MHQPGMLISRDEHDPTIPLVYGTSFGAFSLTWRSRTRGSNGNLGKVTAVVCHATSVLLKTRLSTGELLVEGKTWTGFANAEEAFADNFVGQRIQPFWIEDEAKELSDTNFIVDSAFKAHAVCDGRLITGQQQYSGAAAARLVIEALGV